MILSRLIALPDSAAGPLVRRGRQPGLLAVLAGVLASMLADLAAGQDLSLQLSLADAGRLRGEPLTINFVVANPTTVDVARYRVDFFASPDDSLDNQDRLLGAFRSLDLFRGNSFQENTIELDTCALPLGEWRIFGRVEDVQPDDTNPENDTGLARETLSLPRDDDDPATCAGRQDAVAIINPGLNDAWFNPDTPGQGFFVNVFGDSGNVFLAWFTFDANRPAPEVTPTLGAPGQRWLTAFGTFQGAQATLDVSNTRGGRFDRPDPVPASETVGRLTLGFEDCAAGTVAYEFPELGLAGEIPIRRVADDNTALCEILADSPVTR
jgi:hypothetical protein